MTADPDALREDVKARYAEAARAVSTGETARLRQRLVLRDGRWRRDEVRRGAVRRRAARRAPRRRRTASLGCGNPTAVAELREGETVLDLGSGGGIDVLLSARRVGPTGVVYGLDMTEEMLALAQHNKAEAGADERPLPARRDRERPAARRERRRRDLELRHQPVDRQGAGAARDRPRAQAGGRVGVSDVVAEDRLSPGERAERAPGWAASPVLSRCRSTSRASRRPGSPRSR